ncbi:MAG: phosphoethanolamine transferase [Burkholderiaceae bacterium]|jgi:glucan phosphoethanolaminetransferase (alkaline phosphatase superfamily)|nr:phosphoethanolamine transferase [Burkholderiaceae bacterium]
MKKLSFALPLLFVVLGAFPNVFRIHLPGDLGDLQYIESMAYGVAFMLLWLAVWKRVWLAYATGMVFFSWWLLEIYLRVEFRSGLSSGFFGMVRETNPQEILSFLTTYAFTLVLPWLASMAVFIGLTYASYRSGMAWRHRSRYWVITSFVLLGAMMHFAFEMQEPEGLEPLPDAFQVRQPGFWVSKWGDTYPTNAIFAIRRNYQDQALIRELKSSMAGYAFKVRQTQAEAPDTVVLIIGESSRRDRWSLFGYERNTTPQLQKRSDLVPIGNMVTVSTATRSSVPEMISRHPIQRADGTRPQNPEPSLVALFKQLGYKTYWISNQSTSGFFDTPISFYASEANQQAFPNPANFASRGNMDEALLKPLNASLKSHEKKFIVLHTMGSHFNYSYRYPQSFESFQPALKPNEVFLPSDPSKKQEANNAYDNSILYTDHVLNAILDSLEQQGSKAVAMYLSDHGEDIFEPDCVSMGITRVSEKSFEIPAFLWSSSAYRQQWPAEIEEMRRLAARPLLSQDTFPLLLNFSGITLEDANFPLFSGREQRKVYAQGAWVDFDKEKERDACVIGRR